MLSYTLSHGFISSRTLVRVDSDSEFESVSSCKPQTEHAHLFTCPARIIELTHLFLEPQGIFPIDESTSHVYRFYSTTFDCLFASVYCVYQAAMTVICLLSPIKRPLPCLLGQLKNEAANLPKQQSRNLKTIS